MSISFRTTASLLPVMLLVSGLGLAAEAQVDASAPTVTPRENRMLEKVTSLAETNVAAAIVFLRASDLKTASAALDFALGNLLFQAEQLDQAAAAYEAAIEKSPGFRRAAMNLGRVYLLIGKPDRAAALYSDLLRHGERPDASLLLLLGQALVLTEQPVPAETAFRQAILLKPESREARLGLARCLLSQQRLRELTALLDDLLEEDCSSVELWNLRGQALLAEDGQEAALVSLEAARRLGTANAEMLATLGDLYMNTGLPGEAVGAYEKAFATGAVAVVRQLRAAEALLAGRRSTEAERILARLEAARSHNPKRFSPDEAHQLGRLRAAWLESNGQPEAALTRYRELVAANPMDGDSLLSMGDLQRAAGDREAAMLAYERASRVEGHEARALRRQAMLEVDRKHYERAIQLLEAAQAFDPQAHVSRYIEQLRRLLPH